MKQEVTFENAEKERNFKTILGSEYLYNDMCRGQYKLDDGRIVYPRFILQESTHNLFQPILNKAIRYFSKNENDIKWWSCRECGDNGSAPTKNIMSSQVACINHLFAIRDNPDTVLSVAQSIDPNISEVVLLDNDTKETKGYISFEVVSKNDHLNEGKPNRGEFCTSIDALIIGVRNGKRIMLVIEWKYSESYKDTDKSKEDGKNHPQDSMRSGMTRLNKYSNLILNSTEIVRPESNELSGSVFFFEPFYQLMRQTIWAEQMILHKETECLKADDYIHIHVIPSANTNLLKKIYPVSGKMMEATWREHILHQNKYKIITPETLLGGIDKNEYAQLLDYLRNRYWICDQTTEGNEARTDI